ncbi:L,D-transpeptidase family protein [Allopontixanthobacter sp.]|uniref:L,D-transpeptidase family protein n=1 Tax=Allopontixanthobacter sp. TaxID=2906452 RepID=UPI002ABB4E7F|nr:L,D-transpeptidase family protein [Allopontixanthobacter sp.]MDZ4306519.1 L,D-transpeptidase family protein [Allopontixanthobacter sp.]
MRNIFISASILALAACGFSSTDSDPDETQVATAEVSKPDNLADEMASRDDAMGGDQTDEIPDSSERPVMQAQVVLDRQGFGPGVIDGKMGASTENALRGFQEANGLKVTGELDEATKQKLAAWNKVPATRIVTIPASWSRLTFKEVPESPKKQAEMERLGYNSLDEKLAERFHTTIEVLKSLNPGGKPAGPQNAASAAGQSSANAQPDEEKPVTASVFSPGQTIRVPNIGADRIVPGAIENQDWAKTLASLGVGSEQPEADRVVVSKSGGTLKVFDAQDKLVALFTVTTGSENDPLPLGEWKVNGTAYNPPFAYDPELFWDVPDDDAKQQLPPGPNGPVGVVWIDLSKEHYGIHGTPEPQTIGRAESHGCVRLTNWDAARLAGMVSPGTKVLFEA